MAHVATRAGANKWLPKTCTDSSDEDDDFLSYEFYNTLGGKAPFKPSLGDDYQVGHFSQDHSTQTNRTEVIAVKKLIETTNDLLKDAAVLRRDLGFIRCSMQADFELKLKQKSLELYVRMNERLAAFEKMHAEKVETIRSAYRQQLCDAIVQIHGFYNSDFKKKMKSQELKATTDDGKLKQLKATNDSLEATIQMLMDRLAECEGRDHTVTLPPVADMRDDDKNACNDLKEQLNQLRQKIALLEERLALQEMNKRDHQKEMDKLSKLLVEAQKRIEKLKKQNADLNLQSSSSTSLLDQEREEEAKRARLLNEQMQSYEATMKKMLNDKKALEEFLAKERAATDEWRRKLQECEDSHRGELDLAAEIERLKRELQQVSNAWKKKFAILQDSMRVLRDECYMRQVLHRKATLLHTASVSYAYDTPIDYRKKHTKQQGTSSSASNLNKTAQTPRPDAGRQSSGDYISYTVTPPVDRKTYVLSNNENQVLSDGEDLPPGVIFLPSPPPGRWKSCCS